MSNTPSKPCPCSSSQQMYINCCAPIHQGTQQAQTAEQLMRSRYSAFVLGYEDYLFQSLHPKQRKALPEALNTEIHWNNLDILQTSNGEASDKVGKVEFKAWYRFEGKQQVLHELSRFKKFKGHWYYWDGTIF